MNKDEIKQLHSTLLYETLAVNHLHPSIDNGLPLLKFQAKCRIHLSTPIHRKSVTCTEILEQLETEGVISEGNYDSLKELVSFDIRIVEEIEDVERAIALSKKPKDNERQHRKRKAPESVDKSLYIDGKPSKY